MDGEISVDDESSAIAPKRTWPTGKSVTTAWTHVEIAIRGAQNRLSIETTVEGVAGKNVTSADAAPLRGEKVFVSLGDCATNGTLSWKVLLDELTLTAL